MQLLFADQLGPHFDLGGEILLPEVLGQFRKRRYHRQKAHLILYAIRARALDPRVRLIPLSSYRDLQDATYAFGGLSSIAPTTREMRALCQSLGVELLPARGFASEPADFEAVAAKPRLETFYRKQRVRLNLLMSAGEPEGGQWNFDHENRKPVPKSGLGLAHFVVLENEIDTSVRETLNKLESEGVEFIGEDGARKFAGTRTEALAALQHFIEHQLPLFGAYEDAVHEGEWVLAHSMLSAPMNLGLLDPIEVARAAEAAYYSGHAPLNSVEGFIRQVIGWRDYVWHLYWRFGQEYLDSNFMEASSPLPSSWSDLRADHLEANCLSKTIANVSSNAWAHHIQRLMVLSNFAAQRGINPREFNDWLVDAFVDGTPWVMPANAIGMALFADGGRMSTKPYVSGGAYINKMTNYCGGCRFDPKVRVGDNACPLTAGYWNYLAVNRSKLRGNHRMGQAYAGLTRITEIDQIIDQESKRKSL